MAKAAKTRKPNRRKTTDTPRPAGLMTAPASGVKVRMYRQGHGDCFLLAFPGSNGKPVYVLIDCGYKPGSNVPFGLSPIEDITRDIHAATGGHLDLVIITHEHQDHVNGFPTNFDDFTVGAAWFAWTEDPDDDLANELRRRHRDQLLGLVAARTQLAARGSTAAAGLDRLLSLELGIDDPVAFAAEARKDPANSINKRGMKLIKDKATRKNITFIRPHHKIMAIPGVDGVRVFAFGPPRDADLIADEDPQGSEGFPGQALSGYASFYAAARAAGSELPARNLPFAPKQAVPLTEAFRNPDVGPFFRAHYGNVEADASAGPDSVDDQADVSTGTESLNDASWRRIDRDWLLSAEELALVLNKGINNTSLVLAFELPVSKKVLLFVGDAQRGSWKSWTKGQWRDGSTSITVRDLMSRTVLYKVGHHGSHNATLHGKEDDTYPNLSWMGQGKHGTEITAMITAVQKWAYAVKPKPWRHPLPSIKAALAAKCAGRVFQTDTAQIDRPQGISAAEWQDFQSRTTIDPSGKFFDYEVQDS